MTEFHSWVEAAIAFSVFTPLILLPCYFIATWGIKLVKQIGTYPSKTPVIQMGLFYKVVFLEIIVAVLFWGFYGYFCTR